MSKQAVRLAQTKHARFVFDDTTNILSISSGNDIINVPVGGGGGGSNYNFALPLMLVGNNVLFLMNSIFELINGFLNLKLNQNQGIMNLGGVALNIDTTYFTFTSTGKLTFIPPIADKINSIKTYTGGVAINIDNNGVANLLYYPQDFDIDAQNRLKLSGGLKTKIDSLDIAIYNIGQEIQSFTNLSNFWGTYSQNGKPSDDITYDKNSPTSWDVISEMPTINDYVWVEDITTNITWFYICISVDSAAGTAEFHRVRQFSSDVTSKQNMIQASEISNVNALYGVDTSSVWKEINSLAIFMSDGTTTVEQALQDAFTGIQGVTDLFNQSWANIDIKVQDDKLQWKKNGTSYNVLIDLSQFVQPSQLVPIEDDLTQLNIMLGLLETDIDSKVSDVKVDGVSVVDANKNANINSIDFKPKYSTQTYLRNPTPCETRMVKMGRMVHCQLKMLVSGTAAIDFSVIHDNYLPDDTIYTGGTSLVFVMRSMSTSAGTLRTYTWQPATKTFTSAGTGNSVLNDVVHFSYLSKNEEVSWA